MIQWVRLPWEKSIEKRGANIELSVQKEPVRVSLAGELGKQLSQKPREWRVIG